MKNYPLYSKALTLIMGAIALALIVACFVGCSPYNRLKNRPPKTVKDSLALLARCIEISPVDTTNTHFTPPEVKIEDSSAYFKAILDTLSKRRVIVRDSILKVYVDTCTSAVGLYERGYNEGFDVGALDAKDQEQAKANERYRKLDESCQGAVTFLNEKFQKNAQAYSLKLIEANIQKGQAEKDRDKWRTKYEKWQKAFIIAALLAALFLIVIILMLYFKKKK